MRDGKIAGQKNRNSSIELLRVVCLALIFWMHAAGGFTGDNAVSAWVSIAADVLGNIGVSCFILISGYYAIRLDVRKMLRLDLMLVFYSWIGLILQLAWGNHLGGEAIVSYILPVIGKQSWYFTCYFALAIFSPFLNEMTEKLTRERLFALVAAMIVVFSAVTTIFFFDITGDGGKGIVQMVLLYLLGRYMGMYWSDRKFRTGRLVAISRGSAR